MTDLDQPPRRSPGRWSTPCRPILADLDHDRRVAGLSLPGFGPFLQHHKVRNAVVRLVDDLAGSGDAGLEDGQHHPSRLGHAAARTLQPVRACAPPWPPCWAPAPT